MNLDSANITLQRRDRVNRGAFIMGGLVGLAGVAFVLIPSLLLAFTPHYHGEIIEGAPPAEDFTLPAADGTSFRLSDYRSRIVMLLFGYTNCPDECPATLYQLKLMMSQLGDQAQDVVVVLVTIDPARDTPQRVKEYLGAFHPAFIGVVGNEKQLQPLLEEYDIQIYRPDADEETTNAGIRHTSALYVIDQRGRLRLRLHDGEAASNMVADIQNILKQ